MLSAGKPSCTLLNSSFKNIVESFSDNKLFKYLLFIRVSWFEYILNVSVRVVFGLCIQQNVVKIAGLKNVYHVALHAPQ
jgi:hypothetical protein